MRLAAEAEVLDQRRVVADVVRHEDAPLGRGGAQQGGVVLAGKIRPLGDGDGIDPALPELLRIA